MARYKNINWNLPTRVDGSIANWEALHAAILMDIRDELHQLNGYIGCNNFLELASILRQIEANTKKRTYTKKEKP